MIVRFIGIQALIAKVVDDLGLDYEEVPWESMVNWVAHGLQHIGAYDQFARLSCTLDIVENKAKLPKDFYRVDASIFMEPHKIVLDTIIVGFCDGPLKLHYLALAVDEDGYPMVPDDPTYMDALFWLIASKLAMRGELKNKELTFQFCDQRWKWYCGSARAEGYMPDLQSIQSRSNDFRKLKYDTQPLRNRFRDLGKQQDLRRDAK